MELGCFFFSAAFKSCPRSDFRAPANYRLLYYGMWHNMHVFKNYRVLDSTAIFNLRLSPNRYIRPYNSSRGNLSQWVDVNSAIWLTFVFRVFDVFIHFFGEHLRIVFEVILKISFLAENDVFMRVQVSVKV